MKEDNILVVEGLVILQGKVLSILEVKYGHIITTYTYMINYVTLSPQILLFTIEERFSNVEEKIKYFAERTSSPYIQFRREVNEN
jgi:hypothetical protein